MSHSSNPPVSVHERALQLALKEILAQQQHRGVVPVAPDYQTVVRRAFEIEQMLADAMLDTRQAGPSP